MSGRGEAIVRQGICYKKYLVHHSPITSAMYMASRRQVITMGSNTRKQTARTERLGFGQELTFDWPEEVEREIRDPLGRLFGKVRKNVISVKHKGVELDIVEPKSLKAR